MRATWKGVLQLGKQKLPVKLYAAVHDTTVHFHLLHKKDGTRVEQRLVSSGSGEPVEAKEVQKGFAVEPGTFVILKANELKALEPESSRDIELVKVVPNDALTPAWFERPYLLGPDGDDAAYVALAHALGSQEQQAIVSWSMRGRSYTGALRARGDHLFLIALRDREEVIEAPNMSTPKSRAPDAKELALAEQLVAALEVDGAPDLSQFHSDYHERVHELVESKARGHKLRLVKPRERKPTEGSLEKALRASLGAHTTKRGGRSKKERKSA
ncbi:MAG TPA: Ku protein [Polyangiales bacterium]|nr:Ku protein [Polyangiales bacterium]